MLNGKTSVGDVAGARVSPLNLPDALRHACGVSNLPVAQQVADAVLPATEEQGRNFSLRQFGRAV